MQLQQGPLYRWAYFLARHRRLGLAAWALLAAAALPLAPRALASLSAGGFSSPTMESQRAVDLIGTRFGSFPSALVVLFTSQTLRNDDPSFLGRVDRGLENLRALDVVAGVEGPRENLNQRSADGTTAYALIGLRATDEDFRAVLPRVEAALRGAGADGTIQTFVTGATVFYDDIQAVTERDLRRAEVISFPIAAVALLMVFGSFVAAGLPAIVGAAVVLITLASLVVVSQLTFISIFSLNVVTMLGFGLGIDYALFIVSRFREELARGPDVVEAVARALSTAGQSVLFSGATVFVGLLALISFPYLALRSIGIAGGLVVAISVIGALGLLPLLLLTIGRGIERGRVRLRGPGSERWAWLGERVMAHPVAVIVPVLGVLLMLGLPFLSAQLSAPDVSILPPDVPSRRGSDLLREKFSAGELTPTIMLLTGEGSMLTPDRVAALHDFLERVAADPSVQRVDSPFTLDPRLSREQYQLLYARPDRIPDPYAATGVERGVRDGAVIARVVTVPAQSLDEERSFVRRLRGMTAPPGLTLLVGGGAAASLDYVDGLYERFPQAVGFIAATTFILLFALFGSVVLPVKAIVMNALSILASFGALVVVFQQGFLSGVLGFQPLGYVEASLPILMFCILFGVSMDYEVFLLSRITEAYRETGDNRRAVAQGLQRGASVITSAAAIIVLVALSFVAADVILIKALGLGTAIAVLLDATLVRALLVPATMRLLGRWNWWAPARFRRLLPGPAAVR